jgi:Tol biopolymer transport system component/DNA-binding winged helix-turn-helix (wHTH) protein
MDDLEQVDHLVRFQGFELNLQTGELRKNGTRIRLQEQPFKVLAALVQRPGQLVTREELRKLIWPDESFGDFDHAINLAVTKLRGALGDSADVPHLIETLPRRGYRFVGVVERVNKSPLNLAIIGDGQVAERLSPAPIEAKGGGTGALRYWLRIAAGISVLAACAVVATFVYLKSRPDVQSATLVPTPFTAYPGVEYMPTFSPDGSQIVFAWDGNPPSGSKGFDLYVKVIGSENLLRLTRHPSEAWIGSAWSPDGTRIAFHRIAGEDTGLYIVPALGGPEKKLLSTHKAAGVSAPISWSPDGKWIAFADSLPAADTKNQSICCGNQRLYLLSLETLESKQVPHAEGCIHEAMPAFSHDGKQLAYLCLRNADNFENGLYLIATPESAPRPLTTFVSPGPGFPNGIAWTAGDTKLIVSRPQKGGEYGLDEFSLADGSFRKLSVGQGAAWPAISSKGDKLAFVSSSSYHVDIWRKDLWHPQSSAVKLISSTREQTDAQYSPDGKHITFESTRGGVREIWMSDADGNRLEQISNFKDNLTGTPRWSPDSQKIVFDSRWSGHPEVYISDISELKPRKLVSNIPEMSEPSWSQDGKWIYFVMTTPGTVSGKIYRCPASGGDGIAISGDGVDTPLESLDGKAVYFVTEDAVGGPLSVDWINASSPSNASELEGMPQLWGTPNWTVVSGGIYYVPAESLKSIYYFDFKSKRAHEIFKADKYFGTGLSVSGDGHWILYSQMDEENTDIMLVEHLR